MEFFVLQQQQAIVASKPGTAQDAPDDSFSEESLRVGDDDARRFIGPIALYVVTDECGSTSRAYLSVLDDAIVDEIEEDCCYVDGPFGTLAGWFFDGGSQMPDADNRVVNFR